MGRVVSGDRYAPILKKLHRKPRGRLLRGLRVTTQIEGKQVDMELYASSKIRATADDLAVVRERFGLNMSEAMRVSLHLTANAIRAGRMDL